MGKIAGRAMQDGKTARKMRAQQTKEGGNAADEVVEEVARGVALACDCRRHAVLCVVQFGGAVSRFLKRSMDFSVASSVGKRCVVPALWHFWRRDDCEEVPHVIKSTFDPRDQSEESQQRQFRLSSHRLFNPRDSGEEHQQRRKDLIPHYSVFLKHLSPRFMNPLSFLMTVHMTSS